MVTRRVFILGAGASVEARVPPLAQLHSKILARLKPGDATLRRLMLHFDADVASHSGRPAIVDFISFLDRGLHEGRPLGTGLGVAALQSLRSQFTAVMAKSLGSHRGLRLRIPRAAGLAGQWVTIPSYIRRFVRKLRAGGWARKANRLRFADAVITTNYDTCIDLACYFEAYSARGRFSDVFLGSSFRDPYDDADAFSRPTRPIALLKLHGSLNWLYCPVCGRIFVSAFENNVRYLRLGRRYRGEMTCYCEYYPLEPVLVAPTAIQEFGNQHLAAVWSNAHHVLEEADNWIIVGYSLPSEDVALRTLMYRALESRERLRQPTRIVVVNTQAGRPEVAKRYRSFFGTGRVTLRSLEFGSYVDSVMR